MACEQPLLMRSRESSLTQSNMACEQPLLTRARGASLAFCWRPSGEEVPATVEAECRCAAVWLMSARWSACQLPPESVSISEGVLHVTIGDLHEKTSYDVRLTAVMADGRREVSTVVTSSTLALAPPICTPPSVRCARHDRLLLHWSGPSEQADEVIAYRVRYFDAALRWAARQEVEAKLASRLLRPSEQTTQFLTGQVAMRVPQEKSEQGEEPLEMEGGGGNVAVHFWLTRLAPLHTYCVQVAAVTAGRLGQWSPQSAALSTWRVAPDLQAPQQSFGTHVWVAVGLELAVPVADLAVQDEEPEVFKVVLQPQQGPGKAQCASASREDAALLSARVQLGSFPELADRAIAPYLVLVTGLCPLTTYKCIATSHNHAGAGSPSPPKEVETLAVPPDVCDLRAEHALHDNVLLSWQVFDRGVSAELARVCFEDEGEAALGDRSLCGFTLRLSDIGRPDWREPLCVRRVDPSGERVEFRLGGLAPGTRYRMQVAAVACEPGSGVWSNEAEVLTQELAPPLVGGTLEVWAVTRCRAVLRWPTPVEIAEAPVFAYEISIQRQQGRTAGERQIFPSMPLLSDSGDRSDEPLCVWSEGRMTKAVLNFLEPGSSYAVEVAARTCRGVGAGSSCNVSTRPRAPAMGGDGPQLVCSRCDRLLVSCPGPLPDWGEDEVSDVIGFRARYREASGLVLAGRRSWTEVTVEYTSVEGPAVHFELKDLMPETQYFTQVAALTTLGQGPWSKQGGPFCTWRVAPAAAVPRILLRTHSLLLVGWALEPLDPGCLQVGCDEEIREFTVRTGPSASGWEEVSNLSVPHAEATALAATFLRLIPAKVEKQADQAILCDSPAAFRPAYAAVVPGLLPSHTYVCTVAAVTHAGRGHFSIKSPEVKTLAVAPSVDDPAVDEVEHDQIHISWEVPRKQTPLEPTACEELGLAESVQELELDGFDVRCAPYVPRRSRWLAWGEPTHLELTRVRHDNTGRACFAVSSLEPAQRYTLELRVRSRRGAGEWSRVQKDPVCTAIVSPAPPAPELVYATPDTLTFSFAGSEDASVVAYELRRYEFWMGGWGRPLPPWRFDVDSREVRVTSEQRWVVTLLELRSEARHALQLRGVTRSGGVTCWSQRSEPMHTLRRVTELGEGEEGLARARSPHSERTVQDPAVDGGASTLEELSHVLEVALSCVVDCATVGVRLPSATIPSAAEKAEAIFWEHGSQATAVAAAADLDDEAFSRTKLPDFLIQQMPVVRCSTLLLRELWKSTRRCAVIAHLCGHNTKASETRALILSCLVPRSSATPTSPYAPSAPQSYMEDTLASGRRVVLLVARALAKEAFVHAKESKIAVEVAGLLEVVGMLLRAYDSHPGMSAPGLGEAKEGAEETAGASGPSSLAASVAIGPAGISTAAAEDAGQPSPGRVARTVFQSSQRADERPAIVLVLLGLWLSPVLLRSIEKRLLPLLAWRVAMQLSLAGVVLVVLAMLTASIMVAMWLQRHWEMLIGLPTSLVIMVLTSLPGLSVFLAVRGLLRELGGETFMLLVSFYNLGSGLLRWADDLRDDAAFNPPSPAPWPARLRSLLWTAHQVLGMVLLFDFLTEEMLGEACGLHSMRLLQPQRGMLMLALELAAAWAQARVLRLLQHRTVLLRMLGAQRALLPGIGLLLSGAFAVVQQARVLGFLREVSPGPRWCCAVIWVRQRGAIAGALLPAALALLLVPSGSLPKESLVTVSMVAGLVLGHLASSSFGSLWLARQEQLVADCRMLHILPHVSPDARRKASVALRHFCRGNTDAAVSTAVEESSASVVLRSAVDYVTRLLGGVLSSGPGRPGDRESEIGRTQAKVPLSTKSF